MLYTQQQINDEVLANSVDILGATYPQDLAGEYADGATPIYYSEIIREWLDLPDSDSNRFSECTDSLPERIEELMRYDLYLYYLNAYSSAIAKLVDESEVN